MAKKFTKPKACITCMPLKAVGVKFIGMKVSDVRKKLAKDLKLPKRAAAFVSKDLTLTFRPAGEEYVVQMWDVLEFARNVAGRRYLAGRHPKIISLMRQIGLAAK